MAGGTNNVNVPSNTEFTYSSLVAQLAATTTPTNGQVTFLCAGRLSNLVVTASGAPGAGNNYLVMVLRNGTNSGLFCTINDPAAGCTSTIVIDVDPGDEFNVLIDPNSDPTARNFDWEAQLDPPADSYP